MNIRFTSSLTHEDENTLAPALLGALSGILDVLPIAYVLRIDTSDSHVYQQSNAKPEHADPREVLKPRMSTAAVDSEYV